MRTRRPRTAPRALAPALALALALALAGLAPRPALAQERTGVIVGTVYDDEGMPMAGASVSASSPTQIGGARTTETGADGAFRFVGLIPGVFEVRILKAGFVTSVRRGVRVHVSQTATLDILLDRAAAAAPEEPHPTRAPGPAAAGKRPAKGEKAGRPRAARPPRAETYVIIATRPVVDVTKSTTGESLSDEFVENVPLLGRSYQSVAGMASNVTAQRDPKGSGQGNPTIAGGSYFNNRYSVDGMDTTDPVTHTFATNFNFDAMSDVNVQTGSLGAEYSDTPGGHINMVTKSGSNKFEVDSSIYYQDAALTALDATEKGSTFRKLDANLNVGGPILRDRLWYYASFELNEDERTLSPDPNRILPDHPTRKYLGGKVFAKLTYQPRPRHTLVFWAQADPASLSNVRQRLSVEPDAEEHQNQYGVLSTLAWEWRLTDRLFMKTQLGFGWSGLRIFPESGNQSTPEIYDIGTGVSRRNGGGESVTGDTDGITTDDRYRISLNWDATYFLDHTRVGSHEVKGGFRFQHEENLSTERYSGDEFLRYQFGQPYALTKYFLTFDEASACDTSSAKYDASRCTQGSLSTRVSGNKLIAFLQDTWRLPHYDRLRIIPGAAFHFGNAINPDGKAVTSFATGTVHLNFAWDLFGDGKSVVRGGYNQYVDVGFLALARFIGRDFTSYRCSWDEDTRSYSKSCSVGGQTRTVGYPTGPGVDENGSLKKTNPDALTVPRVHELSLGVEREWLTGFSTGLDFQFRRYQNQWEDLETNVIWNQAGDNAQGFRNGKNEFIYDLETPSQAYRRYISLTFFARRMVGSLQLTASYTWSRTEGTVSEGYATVYLDRARQAIYYDGFLPDDRRHVIKVTGFYNFRKIFVVGGDLWVATGTPYDKLYYNAFFQDYNDRRAVRGYDPRSLSTPDDDAELRTPTRLVLNLKVTYRLGHLTERLFKTPLDLELIGEIFNVFDLRTPTRYEERLLQAGASTQWGDVIEKQDPLRVRFGLRYRY
jgi:hypothetical protein